MRKSAMALVMAAVVMFLFAIPAICADIDGQWVGTVTRADGQKLEMTYVFKIVDGKLLGLVESRLGNGSFEGKIDGNVIEFKVKAGKVEIINNGTLSGEEIHLTETIGKDKAKFVLKRIRRL